MLQRELELHYNKKLSTHNMWFNIFISEHCNIFFFTITSGKKQIKKYTNENYNKIIIYFKNKERNIIKFE